MRCGIIEDRFKVFDGKELEDDMKANKFSFIRYSGMPNDKQSIVRRLLQNVSTLIRKLRILWIDDIRICSGQLSFPV